MPSTPIAYAGFVAMLAVVLFALWAGGRTERIAALVTAGGWILVGLVQDRNGHHVPWASFAVDAVVAAAFVAIAIITGRTWVAFLAAFQMLNLSSYLAFALDRGLFHRAFVTLSYLWSVGVLASLAAGTWSTRQRQLRRDVPI